MLIGCLAVLIGLAGGGAASPEQIMEQLPEPSVILRTLKRDHPRIHIDADAVAELRERVQTESPARRWWLELGAEADKLLGQPACTYDIPDGKRLLSTSRRVVDRIQLLGVAWLITRDDRYADRAWAELEAVSKFRDWNPSHFLDTAEMTYGVALGYDWFHDHWSDQQRQTLRQAIVELGLKPADECYAGRSPYQWWTRSTHNWNQVCNGGIAVGALAIAEEQPELAGRIVHAAVKRLPMAIVNYGPDGAWFEGPGYWAYATRYTVAVIDALQSALGDDFGLSGIEGFAEAGLMPIHCTGPTGHIFNFADAHAGRQVAAEMLWLARRFDRPAYAAWATPRLKPSPRGLIWSDAPGINQSPQNLPRHRHFREAEVFTARSAWGDDQAAYLGIKAGHQALNHANLDCGSFIYEVDQVRWAIDLGPDNYNLPDYFGDQRWDYYRMRAEGHNTLVINPDKRPDQSPRAKTRIVKVDRSGQAIGCTIDLTSAYKDHGARQVQRTIELAERSLRIVDRVRLDEPGDIWWFMHTPAQVTIGEDQRSARLSLDGKALRVSVAQPAAARWQLMDAAPLPTSPNPTGQNPNNGAELINAAMGRITRVGQTPQWGPADPAKAVRKLAMHLGDVGEVTISVLLEPAE
jgi:hypothetical protein